MSDCGKYEVVGHGVVRKDAPRKALGAAVYTGDMKMPGMLYGKALRSKYPTAKILSIDTSEAVEMPGVHAVLTAKDVPGQNRFGLSIEDQEVIASEKTCMLGDPVALVAAETREIAELAVRKIRVEYEELPGVFTIEDALKPDAPLVHDNAPEGGNVLQHTKVRKGNIEEGFKKCKYIVENTYTTQRVEHAYIEPETSLAYWDDDGVMNVMTSTQYTFRDRKQIAKALGMQFNKVRVKEMATGGGFGGKDDITTEIQAALLAYYTHRPVMMTWTREESMIASTKRHPFKIWIRTGCDENGMLQALEARVYSDKGAYCSIGHFITKKVGLHVGGPYVIPNFHTDTYAVYTNNTVGGPFRGFGILQASFVHESQMEQLAELCGMDKWEFRMKNSLRVGLPTATGQVFQHSVGFPDTLLKAKEFMETHPFKELPTDNPAVVRGRGIGCSIYGVGYGFGRPDHAAAMIEVADDGSATILNGACDIGQGSESVMCQICAEELGIPFEKVRMVFADTGCTPDGLCTSASRQTYVSGKAVYLAAQDAKRHLLRYAACLMDCTEEELDVVRNQVVSSRDPALVMDFPELAKLAHDNGKRFIGFAWYDNTTADVDHDTNQGDAYACYIFATQVADVEVDTETGDVTVKRVFASHDVGKAINPMACEQQIEGAVVQGQGYGTIEHVEMKNGYTLTPNFAKYLIPTALDAPEILVDLVEAEDVKGPYGAKGVGEGAIIPTAPAIVNAVYDAIGLRVKNLPVTPEKVLDHLGKL